MMRYRIGSVSLSPARREILSGGLSVPVEPLVLDLIVYLLRNRMRVVTKDELIAALWQGRAVADSSLSSCIKAARRALGDDGRDQRLIRTLHRRGFRFVGEVSEEPETAAEPVIAPPPAETPLSPSNEDPSWGIDLSLPPRPSIAVLPFTLDRSSEDASGFARALQRDVTLGLAQTRWLFVTAHASAAHLASLTSDPAEIGRRLGVRYLLAGTLAKLGRRFRLSLNLTDMSQNREVWVERFERAVDDVFAAQEEIGDLVAAGVEAEIDRRERLAALLRPMDSLDAWTAFHKASDLLNRYSPEAYEEADRLLTLAARAEPGSSRIAAARSLASWQRVFMETAADRAEVRRAFDLARHAVELDPRDANGHWTLGRAAMLQEDLDMAIEEIRTAVSLNRNFAKGQYSLAWASRLRDGSGEMLPKVDLARRLSPYDPLSFAFMNLKADLHLLNGDARAAVEWSSRATRQPYATYHAFAYAARIQVGAGQVETAEKFMAELRRRRPSYSITEYFRAFPYSLELRPAISETFRRLGLR